MSQEQDTLIALAIKKQLGPMFGVMTGAKHFVAIENGLQFSIGSGAAKGINKVVITLLPSDTYNMKFYKIDLMGKDDPFKVIAEHDGVYCDMLQDLFTEETGFYTSF